jgi:hypothetical protein
MEDIKRPKLSLEYIISQLENLDFEQNNNNTIKSLADSLGLNTKCIFIIYTVLNIESKIRIEKSNTDLVLLNGMFARAMLDYEKSISNLSTQNNRQFDSWKIIELELDQLIKRLKIKLIYTRANKVGTELLIQDLVQSRKQTDLIKQVLVTYFRPQVIECLDKTKNNERNRRRIEILTKLLLDNPE